MKRGESDNWLGDGDLSQARRTREPLSTIPGAELIPDRRTERVPKNSINTRRAAFLMVTGQSSMLIRVSGRHVWFMRSRRDAAT